MSKILELTKEQAAYLPAFREEYLQAGIGNSRIDRDNLQSALNDAYKVVGEKPPTLVILESPLQAMLAISVFEGAVKEPKLLEDQLWDQLWSQLRDQLWDQLWDQLGDRLGDQLWNQLWNQLGDQLGGQLSGQLGGQLSGQPEYKSDYLWGAQDLYWISFYKFAEEIGVQYSEDQSHKLEIMRRIGFECEWWWPYKGVCFVSEKSIKSHWREGLLHAENSAAVEYSDGFALYSWRGTSVPSEWITNKEGLTPEIALKWGNVEQRRAACEIIGWDKVPQQR